MEDEGRDRRLKPPRFAGPQSTGYAKADGSQPRYDRRDGRIEEESEGQHKDADAGELLSPATPVDGLPRC
jgi:hypothetical protein